MKAPGDMIDFLDFSNEGGGIRHFDQLYHQYHQAVFANILKMVKSTETSEDILQEVFLSLWLNHKGIETDRVANWLFVVSYNKSLSYLKAASRKYAAPSLKIEDIRDITEEMGINEDEFEWRQMMIRKAVDELPERKRQIFLRYRVNGASLEEIATEMNISVHTVKDHLKIATRMIRSYMSDKYNISLGITALTLLLFFAY
jgi:RNA polymerase sigma-70 factor (family 1)